MKFFYIKYFTQYIDHKKLKISETKFNAKRRPKEKNIFMFIVTPSVCVEYFKSHLNLWFT